MNFQWNSTYQGPPARPMGPFLWLGPGERDGTQRAALDRTLLGGGQSPGLSTI